MMKLRLVEVKTIAWNYTVIETVYNCILNRTKTKIQIWNNQEAATKALTQAAELDTSDGLVQKYQKINITSETRCQIWVGGRGWGEQAAVLKSQQEGAFPGWQNSNKAGELSWPQVEGIGEWVHLTEGVAWVWKKLSHFWQSSQKISESKVHVEDLMFISWSPLTSGLRKKQIRGILVVWPFDIKQEMGCV